MGINPSFKGKKKKNRFLGVPAPGKSQAVSQHQPQKRLRKKQKDLSWEPGYWGRSSQRGSTFYWLDSQSTDTRRHRGAVFNVFPKPQPRRPSQTSGGGAALGVRSRGGPARAELPWRAQAATPAALRACQPDPSPPRSPGSPAAAPALGTTTLAPGRQEMTRKLDATAPEAQNNGWPAGIATSGASPQLPVSAL